MSGFVLRQVWRAAIRLVVAASIAACQQRSPAATTAVDELLDRGRFVEAEAAARAEVAALGANQAANPIAVTAASVRLVRALVLNGRAASQEARALAQQTLEQQEASVHGERLEIVPSLLNLGDVWLAWSDFDQAIATTRRAVALCEAGSGMTGASLAEALDHLGVALAGATSYDEARAVLERSLRLKEASLAPTDVAIARTLEQLGLVLQRMGDYASAGRVLRRASSLQERLHANHPRYVTTLNLLAQQLWFEGQLNQSRDMSSRAVDLAERTLRPNHPTVALSTRYLAATLGDLGDLNGYIELTRRALEMTRTDFGADHFATAEYLHQLGVAEMETGEYQAARRHLQQALRSYESRYGWRHENVATVLSVLALANARLGDLQSARRDQERAAEVYTSVGGPDHPFVAIALTELAGIYNEQGSPKEALPLLQRALTIRQKSLGLEHRDVARSLADMAATLEMLGEPMRAQRLAQQALGIWQRLEVPDAPEHATVLALYAGLQAKRGDNQAALEYYKRSMAIRARVFGTASPIYAETQIGLAVAQAGAGDRTRALQSAASAESAGRDHLRLLLRSLPERQALNYAATRPRGLNLMLSLAESTEEAVAPALDALIRGRALVLDEIAARHGPSQGSLEGTDPARVAFRSAQQRLANLTVRGPAVLAPTQYTSVLEEARRETEAAEEAFAARSATFRAERTRTQLGLDDVRSALSDGSALVSFVQYDRVVEAAAATVGVASRGSRTAGSSYLAFVLRPNRAPAIAHLGTAQEVDRLVSAWISDIHGEVLSRTRGGEAGAASSSSSGAVLRRVIWDRLEAHLDGVERVFVVPDGKLSLAPLAALPSAADSFLLESGPVIHYLTAERDLVAPSDASGRAQGLLAVGGPAFDEASAFERVPTPAPPGPELDSPLSASAGPCSGFQAVRFEPLDGTRQEVNEIGQIWRGDVRGMAARLLVGAEASESAVKRDAPGHRILHLATHGFFLDGLCTPAAVGTTTRGVGGLSANRAASNPLRLSGLALAGANRRAFARPDEEDGILTAEEVSTLDLRGVEWAVLSACDTGVGEIKAGEGVFGLRRAFQVAGARTVIMSLWSVDDQATRAWMRALYEGRFQRRLSTADAVHQASLAVLRDRRANRQSTHPFFWAAFVAAGDWR